MYQSTLDTSAYIPITSLPALHWHFQAIMVPSAYSNQQQYAWQRYADSGPSRLPPRRCHRKCRCQCQPFRLPCVYKGANMNWFTPNVWHRRSISECRGTCTSDATPSTSSRHLLYMGGMPPFNLLLFKVGCLVLPYVASLLPKGCPLLWFLKIDK